jgi:hypothetical protein
MKTRAVLCVGLAQTTATLFLTLLAGSISIPLHGQSVVLNEVVADNQSGLENAADFPDWVELFNNSSINVDLGDWSFTDEILLPRKFVFPLGTVIPANGTLLVYCDNRVTSPGLHSGFALSDKGETLALFASTALGGGLQDQLTFGLQLRDRSIGRVPDGGGNFTLTRPTPFEPNVAEPLGDPSTLKINEWSALNGESVANPDSDWFELYNPDTRPVALEGLVLTDQAAAPATNAALTALSFIEGRGFVEFTADDKLSPADNVNFKLSSTSGDRILLYQPDRFTLIDSVQFGPQTLNISQGRLPDGSANIVFFRTNQPTKGSSNFLPISNVVINEILTHTDPPFEDAIELLNISSVPADISYWWLSDARDEPNKFQIPAGTILPPGGFIVFYEGIGTSMGFNTSGTGESPNFTLNSAHGGELYLFTGDAAGNLTGLRRGIDFEAAENGVSFGRYILSTGEADITAMAWRTFGADSPASVEQFRTGTGLPNATPKVGPVVISEIHYHPPDFISGTNVQDNALDEFVELRNISGTPVPLYDSQYPLNAWRVRGDIDFDFPLGRSLASGENLLLVNFDPANTTLLNEFRGKFNVPSSVAIFGPYDGKLGNGGGTVEVQRPDTPQAPPHPDAGFVPHIVVDRVKYSDEAPWPVAADGTGDSLQRTRVDGYGSEPLFWTSAPPTAGRTGIGTAIRSYQVLGTTLRICFSVSAGQTYSLQSSTSPNGSTWTKVTDVNATTTGEQCVDTAISLSDRARFFRVATPAQ